MLTTHRRCAIALYLTSGDRGLQSQKKRGVGATLVVARPHCRGNDTTHFSEFGHQRCPKIKGLPVYDSEPIRSGSGWWSVNLSGAQREIHFITNPDKLSHLALTP